jgi:hypothetical protein
LPSRAEAVGSAELDQLLGEAMEGRLDRWVAEARVDAAVQERSAERWLRQQAEEEATLTGILVDLAEWQTEVAITTTSGRLHCGRIHQVGVDFVQVVVPGAGPVLVSTAVISSVRTRPGVPPVTGDRVVAPQVRLVERIIGMAEERERAMFVPLDGRSPVCGTVRSVGQDVLVIRLDADTPTTAGYAYLPITTIGEVIPNL